MNDKDEMLKFSKLAVQLAKEGVAELKNNNFAEGRCKMKLAREAANNCQRLLKESHLIMG